MYNRRIAIIDLTAREARTETLEERAINEWIGGALINLHLYKKYSASEPIIIGTGPLTGSPALSSSLTIVTAKSPLSGKVSHVPLTWHIGAEVKYSGFDFIIITGKGKEPCYLWFHDEIPEICDGTKLWKLNVKETVNELRKELGDENIQVITTGEAGRRVSPIAMLSENYWGSKDTCGFGSLFGEKNIIACAFRGLGTFPVDENLFNECLVLRKEHDKVNSPAPNILGFLKETKAPEVLVSLVDGHLHRNNACFNCGFNCYGFVKFREDPKVLKSTEIESPGIMLISPLSATLFYNKSREKFFELFDEAQLLGIEPGLASLITDGTIENKEDLKKIIDESITLKKSINEKILKTVGNISSKIASLCEDGLIPWTLMLNDKIDLNDLYRRTSLGLISGICPVFLLIRREIKTEIIESILKKATGIENLNLNQKIEMFLNLNREST